MRISLALSLALIAGACAGGMRVQAGADYSTSVDFARYATFTWDEPDDRPVGDPRIENNELFETRLHAAVAFELSRSGIRESNPGPALIAHHHVTVRNRVDVYEADAEAGYRSTEYGEGTQVVQYDEGTILVDLADAETRDLIWRGWAQFDIGRALSDPDLMVEAINEAIAKMFEEFPPPRPSTAG